MVSLMTCSVRLTQCAFETTPERILRLPLLLERHFAMHGTRLMQLWHGDSVKVAIGQWHEQQQLIGTSFQRLSVDRAAVEHAEQGGVDSKAAVADETIRLG